MEVVCTLKTLKSALAMLGAVHLFGNGYVPQREEPKRKTSYQILQMVRMGSLRFATIANNHYVGKQLRRLSQCGRNEPCI